MYIPFGSCWNDVDTPHICQSWSFGFSSSPLEFWPDGMAADGSPKICPWDSSLQSKWSIPVPADPSSPVIVNTGLTVLSTRDLGLVIVVLGACVSAEKRRAVRIVGNLCGGKAG